ncbi:hypothetical protein [Chryseobacterium indoltheticum]|uniref:Uncharacterized protein n=1 Tax=Chryseobacterium indoltheticum TaxID=254 RepID=A0A381F539_9FLAO|nr:hypothetical protein [Chryseobacterium indoltheticum]AZA75140.1 hypothetical protein EG358_15810 [Chryseobacterium indoltheticum]SIQ53825.1 hypothetical protein SAMN05421682_10623 [Chryseobacterium indoltheticum]SUX41617.1 Uncharacterised protein [Chryseobacterium indoltheticum]
MALDFHRPDNKEYLFGLDDKKYKNLHEIFTEYKNWTGIYVDPYGDVKLTIENQKMIVKIIDNYIEKTNLNTDKQKTIDILEFRTLLKYFSHQNLEIEIIGD